ncbi:hypothetical protein HPB51_024178 [Rhipicephalus microplus]|uniref:DDE Tnp4 domain-containing protein n=1 Tax=Rhipicephalus microplus TaxID=6941 RepID=A0A9J6DXR5_RHIMP|nr:hypothetical protein HPB51_024178 [Rhipicephalus microplus]
MAYLDMSWSDLEDIFLEVPAIPRPRTFKSAGGFINTSTLDPLTFLRWFRFDQEHLKQLKDDLRNPQVMWSAQGVVVPGEEALLMTPRRFASPMRWCDLEPLFGRTTFTMSSVVSQVIGHVNRVFGRLTTHTWLTLDNLNVFSQAVHNRGAPLFNCWGFVDGTALPICRPSVDQSQYFSGHKRTQVVKYQAVMGANGINASHFPLQRRVSRPFPGKRHGAG